MASVELIKSREDLFRSRSLHIHGSHNRWTLRAPDTEHRAVAAVFDNAAFHPRFQPLFETCRARVDEVFALGRWVDVGEVPALEEAGQ